MTAESAQEKEKLKMLAEKWERISQRRLYDMQFEKAEYGKEMLRATAMCYFNCASELRKALDFPRQNVSGETSRLQR